MTKTVNYAIIFYRGGSMVSKIHLELTLKEFHIVKKALLNYQGKLDYLKERDDLGLEVTQRLIREERLLTYILESIREE